MVVLNISNCNVLPRDHLAGIHFTRRRSLPDRAITFIKTFITDTETGVQDYTTANTTPNK